MTAKAVLLIVSGIMFLVGFLVVFLGVKKRQRCTEPTEATIVDIKRDVDENEKGAKSYSYRPVVEFSVGTQKIRKTAKVSSSSRKAYKVGGTVEVRFNPLKPSEFVTAKQKKGYFSGGTLMLIALAVAVITLIYG